MDDNISNTSKLKIEKLKSIKPFSIEFINVNHSIAGAVALSITTPVGVVFHSGDFKVDYTPVNSETMDINRIAEEWTYLGLVGVIEASLLSLKMIESYVQSSNCIDSFLLKILEVRRKCKQ